MEKLLSAFSRLELIPFLSKVAPVLRSPYNDRHPARSQLSNVAEIDPELPALFGFARNPDGRWIIGAYAAIRFWMELLSGLDQIVQGDVQPDGTFHEWLAADALTQYWHDTHERICIPLPSTASNTSCWLPAEEHLPLYVAALIACIDGPAFSLDVATQTLHRTLPAWPMRLQSDLQRLDLHDANHWPISLCVLPDRLSPDASDVLLHLSSVNGVSKNRALWAAILDGRREPIPVLAGGQRYRPRRVEGRKQYLTDWNDEPLQTSGLSHLALTHRSAFEPELGQSFLHLAGNDLTGAPDIQLFAQQLSRALSIPFDPDWAAQLWHYGLSRDDTETALITPLPSTGCQGYWVLADETRWMRLIVAIQQGITPSALVANALVVTEIGAAARIDEVIEQAGDDDDTDDE